MKPDISHFKQGPVLVFGERFNARGKEWTKTCFNDKTVEIFPGVMQHTPQYIRYLQDLHAELSSKVDLMTDQASGFCYLSSVDQCLIDWGAGPLGTLPPLEDNTLIRQDKGLRSPNADELELIRQLAERVVSQGEWKGIHFKEVSSSGFPMMEKGIPLKVAYFEEIAANPVRFVDLTITEKYEERYRVYGSYPCYTNGIRWQADKVKRTENGSFVTKDRYIFDLKTKEKKRANLPVEIKGQRFEGIFCARWRSMYALTRHDNGLLQGLNNYLHEGAKKAIKGIDYKGPSALSNTLKMFFTELKSHPRFRCKTRVITLDKSEFGETFCPEALEVLLGVIATHLGEKVALYVRRTIDAIVAYKGQYKGKSGVEWTRLTVEKPEEQSLRGSFKSGHALVAFLGEFLGAVDAMLLTRRACEIYNCEWSLDLFCNNAHKHFIYFGKGDDTLFATHSQFKKALIQAVEEKVSLHADELEEFATFLGFKYAHSGSVHVDMAKFIESTTGSERGWRAKTYPAFGVYMKEVLYASNPKFHAINEIINRKLFEHFGFRKDAWIKKYEALGGYSEALQLFLDDPDKLLYQDFIKEQIPDEYLKGIYEQINADRIAEIYQRLK